MFKSLDLAFDFYAEPCEKRIGLSGEYTQITGVFSTSYVLVNDVQTRAESVRLKEHISSNNVFIRRNGIEYKVIESQPDNFGGSLCILQRV